MLGVQYVLSGSVQTAYPRALLMAELADARDGRIVWTQRFQGDLATNLAGTGTRWSEAQLRPRLVDASRLNPQTIMPSYYRTDGLERVGWQWRGQPVLNAQQIEDVVAFLRTLRDAP